MMKVAAKAKAARAVQVRQAVRSAGKRGSRHEPTSAKLSDGERGAAWAAQRSRGLDGDVLDSLAVEMTSVVIDTVWGDVRGTRAPNAVNLRPAVLQEVAKYLLDIAEREDGKRRKAA